MVQIVLHAKAVVGWTRLGYALRRVLQQPDVQGDEALTLQLLLFRQISVAPFVSRRCGTCGATMMIIILVVTAVGRRRCNSVLLEARLAARVAVVGVAGVAVLAAHSSPCKDLTVVLLYKYCSYCEYETCVC